VRLALARKAYRDCNAQLALDIVDPFARAEGPYDPSVAKLCSATNSIDKQLHEYVKSATKGTLIAMIVKGQASLQQLNTFALAMIEKLTAVDIFEVSDQQQAIHTQAIQCARVCLEISRELISLDSAATQLNCVHSPYMLLCM
jgi:hypothetical protein